MSLCVIKDIIVAYGLLIDFTIFVRFAVAVVVSVYYVNYIHVDQRALFAAYASVGVGRVVFDN